MGGMTPGLRDAEIARQQIRRRLVERALEVVMTLSETRLFGVEPGLVLLRESFWNEMLRSNQLFLICISSYQPMSFCGLLELARRAI